MALTKVSNAMRKEGQWVLIGTTEAATDASITQTGLDSTYDTYVCLISDMVCDADAQALRLRLGDSGGIDSGASDYVYHHANSLESGTGYGTGGNTTGADFINITGNTGNTAGEGIGAVIWIHTPQDGSTNILMSGHYAALNSSNVLVGGQWIGARMSSIALDRVQIYFPSNNIASGRFTVYGVAHA